MDNAPNRVIVEMRFSESLEEASLAAGLGSKRPFDVNLVPPIDSIEWDAGFAPVDIPVIPPGPTTYAFHTTDEHPTHQQDANTTYFLRGTVADNSQAAFEAVVEDNQKRNWHLRRL